MLVSEIMYYVLLVPVVAVEYRRIIALTRWWLQAFFIRGEL